MAMSDYHLSDTTSINLRNAFFLRCLGCRERYLKEYMRSTKPFISS